MFAYHVTSVKMANLIENAPHGMGEAVGLCNRIPSDIFAEMCQDVMKVLQYKLGQVNVRRAAEKIRSSGTEVDEKMIQSAVNAVTYIYRSAARGKLSGEELAKELTKSSLFSQKLIDVLKNVWEQQGRQLSASDVSQLLNVGQLIDIKWKLGVAMSSDSCRNLNLPFVNMTLTVSESTGHQSTKTIEMSLIEFQKFSNQMKEMSAVLETV